MPQNSLLTVVIDDEEVGLVQTWIQDASHDRLIVRQELLMTSRLALVLDGVAQLLVLLVHDFQKSANIDV